MNEKKTKIILKLGNYHLGSMPLEYNMCHNQITSYGNQTSNHYWKTFPVEKLKFDKNINDI